jgi:hypothetical protein
MDDSRTKRTGKSGSLSVNLMKPLAVDFAFRLRHFKGSWEGKAKEELNKLLATHPQFDTNR